MNLHEVVGNLHMHTPYSDGEKWHREIASAAIGAGLDFVVVTDHNIWVDGVEGYVGDDDGRVLLLVGEEVHDRRRQPQCNHFLVYGAEAEMCRHAADPQALIDAVRARGACGFLAHPHERDLPLFGEPELGWHDWDVEGYTGLEIWNYMSTFKTAIAVQHDRLPTTNSLVGKLAALPVAFRPANYVTGPDPATLALWDQLLAQGRRVAGVGNSDAHGTPMRLGPIRREILPYDFLFRAVNTHLLLPRPLTGDIVADKALILGAVGRGNGWIGYDLIGSTRGFRFSGHGRTRGGMGDEVLLDAGATLQVSAPARCRIRLMRHGDVVAEAADDTNLMHVPVTEGAYRAECYRRHAGRERGWIFSNPIYLR